MTSKIYVVTDLGPGDGGKGGVVHKISTMMRAHTVIKRGGFQGSHGVRTSRGEESAFSQWGCGTFEGIPTYLSEQMIVSPEGLLNEAAHLRYRHGIDNAFGLLTVDERAVCATPFHGIASRLKELSRRDTPRGTVGTGAGEAYRSYRQQPNLALTARDLSSPDLRDRLAAIRQTIQVELQPVVAGAYLVTDQVARDKELQLLYDDGFLDYVAARFAEVARQATIVDDDYLGSTILTRAGIAVVETSHGVLTDRQTGLQPHTSAIRTLPRFTQVMLEEAGYAEQIVHLGVTRGYSFRHGAGPMPTADPTMAERLRLDYAHDDNRYQGSVRVGPLDFELLRHAVQACDGPITFAGLAVTCMDQVRASGVWELCERYEVAERGTPIARRKPCITRIPIDPVTSNDALYGICAETMQALVDIPVRMVSFGPTELDKLCK